jgi:hypothetical protein
MSGPAWLVGILAGIMATTALYACARLLAAWRWGRRLHYGIDVTHVLMGTAMGGMLVPSLDFLPEIAWLFVFAVMSAWFSWTTLQFVVRRGIRGEDEDRVHHGSHFLTHSVMGYSMLYMYLAPGKVHAAVSVMAMSPGVGGASQFTWLSPFFIVVLFASAAWELDRSPRLVSSPLEAVAAGMLSSSPAGSSRAVSLPTEGSDRPGEPPDGRLWLAPRLEAACHVAMCLTMGYMLILTR